MAAAITSAEQRIVELGIEMPPAPQPLGSYTETVQSGRLLFVAGTIPTLAGKLQYTGMIGKELDLATGQQAARIAALNALAAARQHLGSLDRVTRVLKTEVWLVTTDDFVAKALLPFEINGLHCEPDVSRRNSVASCSS